MSLPPIGHSIREKIDDDVAEEIKIIGSKYYVIFGDLSREFTAMEFGKPRMGKSYLCIDFAE